MNNQYVLKYVSRHLHTNVRQYDRTNTLVKIFKSNTAVHDIFTDEQILKLFTNAKERNLAEPQILTVNHNYTYGFIPTVDYSCIVGPVEIYYTGGMIEYEMHDELKKMPDKIPSFDFRTFEEDILLIYNLNRENAVGIGDIQMWKTEKHHTCESVKKDFLNLVFQNRENGRKHNPYDQELRIMTSIENGDIKHLKESISEDYDGEIGTLAKDALRHIKNLGIVILSLSSRAAIRGGILPEIAYSLCDSYIMKIEDCKDSSSVIHLFRSAEFEYTIMVNDLKTQHAGTYAQMQNLQITKCKTYISLHLHERIKIYEIANALELNANYLSDLFRKCENQPLTEYIRQEKLNLTKNFLIYSNYTYSEIATYLGFSSQSHLGKYFKRDTNMTLRQYREKYGVKT